MEDATRKRIAQLSLEDGLNPLFFGLYFMISGSFALAGSAVPRESFWFDFFNLGFVQLALMAAAIFGLRKAKLVLAAPRVGFVAPKIPKWSMALGFVMVGCIAFLFALRPAGMSDLISRVGTSVVAIPFAVMFVTMGVSARLPRMLWLGVVVLAIGIVAYLTRATYGSVMLALGSAVTIVCLLQLRSFLKTHPRPVETDVHG
jgi:hypothetical protein